MFTHADYYLNLMRNVPVVGLHWRRLRIVVHGMVLRQHWAHVGVGRQERGHTVADAAVDRHWALPLDAASNPHAIAVDWNRGADHLARVHRDRVAGRAQPDARHHTQLLLMLGDVHLMVAHVLHHHHPIVALRADALLHLQLHVHRLLQLAAVRRMPANGSNLSTQICTNGSAENGITRVRN